MPTLVPTPSPGHLPWSGVDLRHESWAVLSVGDGDEVVVLEGPATVVEDDAEQATVDAAYCAKYVDPALGARAGVRAADVDPWRVDVHHVMTWVYGDISGRTDWRREPA